MADYIRERGSPLAAEAHAPHRDSAEEQAGDGE